MAGVRTEIRIAVHLRAHQRRRAADVGRIEGEEDVVIETDGHPKAGKQDIF